MSERTILPEIMINGFTRNLWNTKLQSTLANDIQFLGVHLDSHLSFNIHAMDIKHKMRQGNNLMKKMLTIVIWQL